MNNIQQAGYYYYRKSTILFFTNNGEKEYNNLIKKQQYLAWVDLPQHQKNLFESVALFCSKNQIVQFDKYTKRPLKPQTPLFLYFRVVEEKLKKDYPKLKQSQIFQIAEKKWKNELIFRIKEQFIKIHQILELCYYNDITEYKKANIELENSHYEKKVAQKEQKSLPLLKKNTLTRQCAAYYNQNQSKNHLQQIPNNLNFTSTQQYQVIY
ncbi:high mobility group (HMG)-box protein (macronuclear) [Tetrahymena thermophila SB210]|uniref:High mobility group (HMG)-box protein n=1 Tax=Tetrahymena thermophila (strain SB210) TaxID=312017 RepID=Q247X0_TETTS|nr:high mobility group (HMG)-box protein [Tetrahymena thermophila SB210]EAS04175.1 high mobility group (HMG)-box protein [Tetrahymena thermophila SB210]|eukprot:XP_001024420.1 high mobility group (HMG)-box protein [Tetrahymena thermophila SB210]